MPKISIKNGKGRIVWDKDDWLAGVEKIENTAGSDSMEGGFTKDTFSIDPLRKYGYLTVGKNPVAVTNHSSIDGIIKNGVIKGDNAYLIASNKVHKLGTLAAGTINVTSPFPYTLVHGEHNSVVGHDIVNYCVGTTLKAFYSISDATDWDVGVYDYTSDAFDPDFMSTEPDNKLADNWLGDGDADYLTYGASKTIPLIVGDDDLLYMGCGRYLHAFDGQAGANGTFHGAVLTLPQGWTITCLARTNNRKIAVGAYYSSAQGASTFNKGKAAIWIYDHLNLDPEAIYWLDDNYISEVFSWNGTLACFTNGVKAGRNAGTVKLKYLTNPGLDGDYSGTSFKTLVSYNGSAPIRGGVEIIDGDIYWNGGGNVYAFVNLDGKYSLHKIARDNGSNSGMLKSFTQISNLHISSGISSSGGGLDYLSSNYREAGGAYFSKVYLPSENDKKYRITSLGITLDDAYAGDGRGFTINAEKDASDDVMITVKGALPKKKIWYEKTSDLWESFGKKFGEFTCIAPIFLWNNNISGGGITSAPVIVRFEIEFELINK